MFRWPTDNELHTVGDCPNLGCCGYVFKEDLKHMYSEPIRYVIEIDTLTSVFVDGCIPAQLGWVAFKEEVE